MATTPAAPVGDLQTALAHAARLLNADPALAEAQCREILTAIPGQPEAQVLLAAALRRRGEGEAALALLGPLCAARADWAAAWLELGLAHAACADPVRATGAVASAIGRDPRLTYAWRLLGDELTRSGETEAADEAYGRHVRAAVTDPELVQAAQALSDGRLAAAERILRAVLKRRATDVAAMRMLAETGARLGRHEDAEALLSRCLELAPGFEAARRNYATVLYRQNKPAEALAQADRLLQDRPADLGYRNLRAAALARLGDHEAAIAGYREVLQEAPRQPKAWMSLGHVLKTVGRQEESIAAYRQSLAQAPSLGEAWWSLANLKTFRFGPEEMQAMRRQLERTDLADDDRLHLQFALGKALEDQGEAADAFAAYAAGARLRRAAVHHDPDAMSEHVRRCKALFTPAFFAGRAGWGDPAADPIFVVGLPRAGSTLVEQILASHPQVEGTMELPDVIALARRLGGRRRGRASAYPESLADLTAEETAALGGEYLERTRPHRRLGRARFVDKMPNNFEHLGLICLMLPNARIIDARRHPLGCGFSAFKQHFARGQAFTYDLTELGRYYRDYVELMAHFDQVLPGRVHRVIYEEMVADPEGQIRRLLDHCGLPFDAACLAFHQTRRAVRTASSEQVRQPIFTDAVDQWRAYEPWLAPLKQALGPVLDAYPAAPAF